MRNILLIAKREYLEKIKGKAFRVSTALVPLLGLMVLASGYLTGRQTSSIKHVKIVADDAVLANIVRTQLVADTDMRFTVDVMPPGVSDDHTALVKMARTRDIDGVLVIKTAPLAGTVNTYLTRYADDILCTAELKNVLTRSLVRERLSASQPLYPHSDAVIEDATIETVHVNRNGTEGRPNGEYSYYKAIVMAVLLTMPILLYGMDMARSIVEEKASRIFEVMLSMATPEDLLTGKLIGVGAVGLTQIGIWVVAGALLSASGVFAAILAGGLPVHFSWADIVLFPVYFVLGFFLYSAIFSGLAATCQTAQDLQMYVPLAIVPTWVSFSVIPLLLRDPDSIWVAVAALCPLTAPFVMVSRVALQIAPAWEVVVSIIFMLLTIRGVLWFSSRLYRTGILMYGKRATIPELLRWMRYN